MTRRFTGLILSLLMLAAVSAGAADGKETVARSSLLDMVHAGGWTMYVILAMSVVGVFLTIYLLFVLREKVLCPRQLVRELEEMAAYGDVSALQAACKANDTVLTRVLAGVLDHLQVDPKADFAELNSAMEEEGARQTMVLWQEAQYLLDVAVVAPMVGLLGTVFGMVRSFAGMNTELGSVIPTELAHGVAQALVCTASGLVLAIPAMFLYAVFRTRVQTLAAVLESSCGRILRRLSYAIENPPQGKKPASRSHQP